MSLKNWWVYSYNTHSQSAGDLAKSLGVRRIRRENSRFVARDNRVIINWGSNSMPENYERCRVINSPRCVRRATDKLDFFRVMQDASVPIPDFTSDRSAAEGWIRDGDKVVCRTMTRASSGRGIVLATSLDELVNAPLYTKYKKKKDEYRVHIFMDGVLDVQRKTRNSSVPREEVNFQIRTHDNGFIYQRQNLQVPDRVLQIARQAVTAANLDFGAVDVIYNRHYDEANVLEINTAPGLTGQTLINYTEAFTEYANGT